MISAALIVKNEGRFLGGCLESLRGLVAETVVVDTGSTDETVEIARSFGARLFRFPWRGRFDDARNAALERCRAPWILYIDADERVRPCERARLKADLDAPGCLAARVRFYPKVGYTPYLETRLIRNHPKLRFRSGIHETILPALEETLIREGGTIQDTDLAIDHLGYEGDLAHKHKRNLPLLRVAVKEDSRRYYLWCELARAAVALGENEEAEAAWREAMNIVEALPMRRPTEVLPYIDWIGYQLSRGEDPGETLEKALALFPDDAQVRWQMARHLIEGEQHARALPLLEELVARPEGTVSAGGIAYDSTIFGALPREALGICCFRLGRYAEARKWFLRAARLAPEDPTLRARAVVAGARAGPRGGADADTLLIRGPYRSTTGYGALTRSLAMALLEIGTPLEIEDVPRFSPDLLPAGAVPRALEGLDPHIDARRVLQVCLPTLARAVTGGRSVLYTQFEGTRLPESWAATSEAHDLLVLPGEASRDAWIASGYPAERIRLCPQGVDLTRYHPGVAPLDLPDGLGGSVLTRRVRFLSVLVAIPRKNLPGLLRVWLRATRSEDDAVLILKVGRASEAQTAALERTLRSVEDSVGRAWRAAAPVVWVADSLPDEALPSLFATATHYVSLSFGEGWDLPMSQAAAMGKRLLAPAHSGYRAYLDPSVARLIPAKTVPALGESDDAARAILELAPWSAELFGEASWWAPDEEAAAAAVREAIDDPDGPWPCARERMQAFTWEASARRLREILRELGD